MHRLKIESERIIAMHVPSALFSMCKYNPRLVLPPVELGIAFSWLNAKVAAHNYIFADQGLCLIAFVRNRFCREIPIYNPNPKTWNNRFNNQILNLFPDSTTKVRFTPQVLPVLQLFLQNLYTKLL